MIKDLQIKQLKEELIELEGKGNENEILKIGGYAAKDTGAVINIIVGLGIVSLSVAFMNITDYNTGLLLLMLFAGVAFLTVGLIQKFNAKEAYEEFQKGKKDKEKRLVEIRKQLMELEEEIKDFEEQQISTIKSNNCSVADELLKLASLLSNKLITQEEYTLLKTNLLKGIKDI